MMVVVDNIICVVRCAHVINVIQFMHLRIAFAHFNISTSTRENHCSFLAEDSLCPKVQNDIPKSTLPGLTL